MRRVLSALSMAAVILFGGSAQAASWNVTSVTVPGSTYTQPWGVNDSGVIVGSDDFGGFLDDHGTITTVNPPGGWALAPDGDYVGIIGSPSGGGFATFDLVAGGTSIIYGLNDSGQAVGWYSDAAGNTHGFLATTAVPEPSQAVLMLIGALAAGRRLAGRRRRQQDLHPEATSMTSVPGTISRAS